MTSTLWGNIKWSDLILLWSKGIYSNKTCCEAVLKFACVSLIKTDLDKL